MKISEVGTCCPESGLGGLVEVVESQAGSKGGRGMRGLRVRVRACVRACACGGVGGVMCVFGVCVHVCTRVHTCKAQVWRRCTGHKEAFRGVRQAMRQASLQRSLRAHWVVRKQRTGEQVHGLPFLLSVGASFRLRNSKQVLVAFGEGIWGHILVSQVLTTFGRGILGQILVRQGLTLTQCSSATC